ncbi:CDP-alcohol phosphatidyltransferase family protein [Nocardiopsis sp. ATB16-24]|uniref:CDP-alcohol phosphatidyltransferase family protein n=1 Tax=Nocardiopsis sp. ATB16-24 TaxID=3019555 RepID=UPI0025536C23|nr:CDP-alcohol phosphatidyltransferase family protein [Nocardiopsis sp. ATB16-24]
MDERRVLVAGACAQVLVLATLASTVGLGVVGWTAGVLYLVSGVTVLAWTARRTRPRTWGPADLVTLCRALLVGAVTALVVDGGHGWPVVVLASIALVLDLVDGPVARCTRTASPFGARFDMEVDAFLLLVLSVHAASLLGPWVIAIGAMRYVFALAGRAAPWLRAPLPPSRARRVVAGAQGAALVTASSQVLAPWGSVAVTGGALAALVWSFGRDAVGLWRARGGVRLPAVGGG